MSDGTGISTAGAIPSGEAAADGAPPVVQPVDASNSSLHPNKQEIMALLARVTNESLAELGYYPTLLPEHAELQKTCAKLRADNTKLYADNRSLALFIQEQDERRRILEAPQDQHKQLLTQMHERIRALTQERDEAMAKLHAASNEVMMLRQELARFVPNGMVAAAPPGWPTSNPSPVGPHPVHNGRRSATYPTPVGMSYMQPQMAQPNGLPPQAMVGYPRQQQMPAPMQQVAYARPRSSLPALSPVDTTMAPPMIVHQRRPSAPTAITIPHALHTHSPTTASPLNHFSSMTLASAPTTPVTSRPGTANGAGSHPRSASSSRPSSSRGPYVQPPPLMRASSSSLAGAITDPSQITEEVARKRRKLEHTTAALPNTPSQGYLPMVSPVVPPAHISMASRVSQPGTPTTTLQLYTIPPARPHPHQPPTLLHQYAMSPTQPSQPQLTQHSQPPPAPPPTSIKQSPQVAPLMAVGRPPAESIQHTEKAIKPPDSQPADAVTTDAQAPPGQLDSITEECLEASYEQDDDDETKLWCLMCQRRFEAGHDSKPPAPFVRAPKEELVAHCRTVHPAGWEMLIKKLTESAAKEV